MKKSEGRGGKPGETLQIAILTLFMTGGGFALIALVLWLFLVPGRAEDYRRQVEDHNKLAAFLDPRNNQNTKIWTLKTRAEEARKTQGNQSLREMVESNLDRLQVSSIPQTDKVPAKVGGSVEHRQSMVLKDAALQDVFEFIGRVLTENQSVKVSVLNFNRASRGADDDKWTVNVTFQLFTTRDSSRPAERPGQKAEPEPEADAKAEAELETPPPGEAPIAEEAKE